MPLEPRYIVWAIVYIYLFVSLQLSGMPFWGAQHGNGWTWEHSIAEWAEISARPQWKQVYGPVPVHDATGFYERWETIWVKE